MAVLAAEPRIQLKSGDFRRFLPCRVGPLEESVGIETDSALAGHRDAKPPAKSAVISVTTVNSDSRMGRMRPYFGDRAVWERGYFSGRRTC